jgi:unsaturated rhamnogalacturonyl hydrolase
MKIKIMKKTILTLIVFLCLFNSYAEKLSVKMADSEMQRFPHLYEFDYGKRLYFGYTQGLGGMAFLKLWQATGNKKYYKYVYEWGDSIISKDGSIYLYKMDEYSLDFINSGKVLFGLYEISGEKRFRMAMDTLMKQFENHPRTTEGGFWHKKRYTSQMWLDGLYMASPFIAQYGATFNKPECIDETINQLTIIARHTYDEKSGLFYHAWDESRSQKWADPLTGTSPNFWGRSIGWFAMALVDDLDFIPAGHPRRSEILVLVRKLADGMLRYQDNKTGLWYQVVNQGNREGNYPEASVSSMMMYFYAKASNKGYLPCRYRRVALKAYNGIKRHLIVKNHDGTISLTKCCAVAGLGGDPYRDGSYGYYINEKIRDNDGKATGPFIMGCLELNR